MTFGYLESFQSIANKGVSADFSFYGKNLLFLRFKQRRQEGAETGQAAQALQELRTSIRAKFQSQAKLYRRIIFTGESDRQADCLRAKRSVRTVFRHLAKIDFHAEPPKPR